MGLLDKFYAAGEPALGLLSGAVAEPVAGWAGILSGGSKQAVDGARNALTYQPRTAAGKAGQNALANALLGIKTAVVDNNPPVRMAVEGYNALADRAGLLSPALGAAVKTAPVALGLFAGPGSAQTRQAFAHVAGDTAKALGPKFGEMAEQYMAKNGLLQPMIAYHGSPHQFDKFDMSKVGTGEGAQAYGHGMYFAEHPDVAKSYMASETNSSTANYLYNGKLIPPDDELRRSAAYYLSTFKGDKAAVLDSYGPRYYETPSGKKFKKLVESMDYEKLRPAGSLYKVDIPDEHVGRFLDWDKPLSAQPEAVRVAAMDLGLATNATGKDLYNAMATQARDAAIGRGQNALTTLGASQAAASNDLSGFGIPGIRYLDQGSRGAGAGTSNFVVFDPTTVKMLERNGMPLQNPMDTLMEKLRRRNLESASLNPY